jgi:hypothetical protein
MEALGGWCESRSHSVKLGGGMGKRKFENKYLINMIYRVINVLFWTV